MENASKALLMAGGILIALLVVGALLLMFNQLSEYQSSNSDLIQTEQLAKFNEEYTQYSRDDLKGVELISLANKVVDYNRKSGGVGEINYGHKITLTININQKKYENMLAEKPQVFTFAQYIIDENTSSNSPFFNSITTYRAYEEKNTLNNMKKLISQIDGLKDGEITVQEIIGTTFKDERGNTITDRDTIVSSLIKYQEYSSFKNATFKAEVKDYHENGQIKSMTVEFVG